MVRIQVKHGGDEEEDQKEFLYESPTTSTIDEIAKDVIQIANLQSKILRLSLHLQPRLSPLINTDPKVIPLSRALSEAEAYASKNQVLHNKPLSICVLKGHKQSIEREFTGSYDIMGFPDSNIRQLLPGLEAIKEDITKLWWAGKELMRGKRLCDYIGKNEKTKIILRLQSPSSHPVCNSVQ
ncbi:unnamed protein product [Ilex paraguariensis]|uniref:Uncharacterized protein n=1 Tax=Ilex paraguariensis TaxID=185542 RepID=A0ABC8U4H5_9AQUA